MAAVVIFGLIMVSTAPANAGPADMGARAFEQGRMRLAQGDFDGALTAFKAAAKGDRKNPEYMQQYAVLRQVVRMRESLPSVRDNDRWLEDAAALCSFYHEHGLYAESLPLDEERYGRVPSAESAVLLARTQLALDANGPAAAFLGGLPDELRPAEVRVLHGLALARVGKLDEAKPAADVAVATDGDADPMTHFELARLRALVSRSNDAFTALTRAIELTPPSRLDGFKDRIRKCPDLAGLRETPRFAEVLKTASKVKESPCSGGSGCGKCPKRGDCDSAKSAKAGDKK